MVAGQVKATSLQNYYLNSLKSCTKTQIQRKTKKGSQPSLSANCHVLASTCTGMYKIIAGSSSMCI